MSIALDACRVGKRERNYSFGHSLFSSYQKSGSHNSPEFHVFPGILHPPRIVGTRNSIYLISVISLNIGKYIATTMKPTDPPRNTISIGSIMAVRLDTAESTSSS
jgi:hypothetical protein